jgi:hypothetical protein
MHCGCEMRNCEQIDFLYDYDMMSLFHGLIKSCAMRSGNTP